MEILRFIHIYKQPKTQHCEEIIDVGIPYFRGRRGRAEILRDEATLRKRLAEKLPTPT